MSEQQRLAVEDLIRGGPDLGSGTLDEMRAAFEGLGQITPADGRTRSEPGVIAGVRCEYITPDNAVEGTVILFFHGGGYVIGSLNTHRGLASILAVRAAATLVAVDYRLAPEHPFPAAAQDGLAVYRAMIAGGQSPGTIAIAGDSAGGGLALATLMQARDEGLPMPAAAFLMSPFIDLAGTGASVLEKRDVDVIVRPGMIDGMAATFLAGADARNPLASPLYGEFQGLPPILVHVGSYEAILDDSLRLVRKAAVADVAVEVKVWPRLPHVWQLFAGMLDEGHQSLAEAGAFVRERFASSR